MAITVSLLSAAFHPGETLEYVIRLSAAGEARAGGVLDYVVTEVSGKWSCDRFFVKPFAHPPLTKDYLDNHEMPAISVSKGVVRDGEPWYAALQDANGLGGGGRVGLNGLIFRSQALVVCEKEQVAVGTSVGFRVRCVLPEELPLSFRGTAMRYGYAVTVVIGVGGREKVVRVPFRVVSAGGTGGEEEWMKKDVRVPVSREVGPRGLLFLEERERGALDMACEVVKGGVIDDIEMALALSLNGRLTPYRREGGEEESLGPAKRGGGVVYGVNVGNKRVGKVWLGEKVQRVGGNVGLAFWFGKGEGCWWVRVWLEMQEIVKEDYVVGEGELVFRKVYGEAEYFVGGKRNLNVVMSIPEDASPSFRTQVVDVKWAVMVEFGVRIETEESEETALRVGGGGDVDEMQVLMENLEVDEGESGWDGTQWKGGEKERWGFLETGRVDILKWTLPLVVSGKRGGVRGGRGAERMVCYGD